MEYRPKYDLEEILNKARDGDPIASQELLTHHCKVWTHEELLALNCYRKGKDQPSTYPRSNSISTFYVKKDFQSKPELVTVDWYEEFDAQYDLYCLNFQSGEKQLWMFKGNKPICNVTDWSKRDVHEEGKAKTEKEKRLSRIFIKPNQQPWNRR